MQVGSPQSGFSWASQVTLDSGEEGDPANQGQIDDLIASFNGAEKLLFDVTFPDDQFPGASYFLVTVL